MKLKCWQQIAASWQRKQQQQCRYRQITKMDVHTYVRINKCTSLLVIVCGNTVCCLTKSEIEIVLKLWDTAGRTQQSNAVKWINMDSDKWWGRRTTVGTDGQFYEYLNMDLGYWVTNPQRNIYIYTTSSTRSSLVSV